MAAVLLVAGCRAGTPGLEPVTDPPDLRAALSNRYGLTQALRRSLAWFDRPESDAYFGPESMVGHARARVQDFQGHLSIQRLLVGDEYGAHPSSPDLGSDGEVAQLAPDERATRRGGGEL